MKHLGCMLFSLSQGAWLLCGCYDSGAADRPVMDTSAPPTEAAYVTARGEAEAELAADCCAQNGYAGASNDYANLVERGLRSFAPDPDAGARYDAEAAAECLASIRDAGCTELVKAPSTMSSPCNRVYTRGHGQIGDPCRVHFDCALSDGNETSCEARVVSGEIARSCALFVLAGEGEACTGAEGTAVYCEGDLLCDDSRGICVRRAARGEPCMTGPSYGDTCEVGSVCDRQGSKRCVEPTPVAEACDPNDNLCEGFACGAGTCREPLFVTSGGWSCRE